jgi:hypothetical protein
MQRQHNAVQLLAAGGPVCFEKTGLRSRRHHQHHDPGAPDPVERHETPDPVRSHMKRPVKLLLFLCPVYPVI